MRYAAENGCSFNAHTCKFAAMGKSLDCMVCYYRLSHDLGRNLDCIFLSNAKKNLFVVKTNPMLA